MQFVFCLKSIYSVFFHIECVRIIIASFDPVHGPEIVIRLCSLLKTSRNLVRNMSDALKPQSVVFYASLVFLTYFHDSVRS